MSKGLTIVLGLALVWFSAWQIAGYFMREAGTEKLAQAEHVSTPATRLEPGADVRVEAIIAEGPTTKAPFSETPCLAAVTRIGIAASYTDSQGKRAESYEPVTTRSAGPANIGIAVGDERLELPLELWLPHHMQTHSMGQLPERLGVTAQEIASAEARLLHGPSNRFWVDEATIDAGTQVFVVGTLENGADALRLAPDRVLDRVLVHPGTQADYVAKVRGSGGGLRVAGWIFSLGLGPLPLIVIGAVLLLRSRAEASPANVGVHAS